MNKLDFLRAEYNVKYVAHCSFLNIECVIEKTKSSERDGMFLVCYPNDKMRTRHFTFFSIKRKK